MDAKMLQSFTMGTPEMVLMILGKPQIACPELVA